MGRRHGRRRDQHEPRRQVATDGTDPMSQAVDRLTEFRCAVRHRRRKLRPARKPSPRPAARPRSDRRRRRRPGRGRVVLLAGPARRRGRQAGDRRARRRHRRPRGPPARRWATCSTPTTPRSTAPRWRHRTSRVRPRSWPRNIPAWTGAELKAQLIGTSKHLAGAPVTFQGAGRVDVAAAVKDPVTVDTAALCLGRVPQQAGPVHAHPHLRQCDRQARPAAAVRTGARHRRRREPQSEPRLRPPDRLNPGARHRQRAGDPVAEAHRCGRLRRAARRRGGRPAERGCSQRHVVRRRRPAPDGHRARRRPRRTPGGRPGGPVEREHRRIQQGVGGRRDRHHPGARWRLHRDDDDSGRRCPARRTDDGG